MMNKLQAAEQLRKALQMFVRSLSDDEAIEVAAVYPKWHNNTAYKVGDIVAYGVNKADDPQLYRCVQAHTSQSDWTPDAAVSLWSAIRLAPDNIPIWTQPTGAQDAYNIGDKVWYPDKGDVIYESLINGNVWSPGSYPNGWEVVEE